MPGFKHFFHPKLYNLDDAVSRKAVSIERTEGVFIMVPPHFAPKPGYPEAQAAISAQMEAIRTARPGKVVALSSVGGHRFSGLGLITQVRLLEEALAKLNDTPVSIDHVGANADDANEKAKEAGASAMKSVDGVSKATGLVAAVSSRIHETANQIEVLSKRVRDIDNITLVIKEVAAQTNLLALNAAIEAARAGEQGRGFAVVADEVRKLAERTMNSVAEIGELIQTIQAESLAAVDSMGVALYTALTTIDD